MSRQHQSTRLQPAVRQQLGQPQERPVRAVDAHAAARHRASIGARLRHRLPVAQRGDLLVREPGLGQALQGGVRRQQMLAALPRPASAASS